MCAVDIVNVRVPCYPVLVYQESRVQARSAGSVDARLQPRMIMATDAHMQLRPSFIQAKTSDGAKAPCPVPAGDEAAHLGKVWFDFHNLELVEANLHLIGAPSWLQVCQRGVDDLQAKGRNTCPEAGNGAGERDRVRPSLKCRQART